MNLILEPLIDWPLVLSQPRYSGGHEEVMRNIFGKNAEVLDFWNEGDWQGTIAVAYKFSNGEVAIMTDYYGSCGYCDAWADSNKEDARNMILGLCGSAKQFDSVELAKEWIKNIDSEKQPWHYPWQAAKKSGTMKTPKTDEIIKYCDYQFPATQGHIPLRKMIEDIEKENESLKELLSEIQDWILDNDHECGPVGASLYGLYEKIEKHLSK